MNEEMKEKQLKMSRKIMTLTFFKFYRVYIKLGQSFFPYYTLTCLKKGTAILLEVMNIWTS